jgi:hypothetical protein
MCEEQQTKIGALIAEAIWRQASKLVEQQAVALKAPATPLSDATMQSDKEAGDES